MGSPGGSAVKSLPANAVDTGLSLGSRRSPGKGNGNPRLTWKARKTLPGKPHDRGGWQATVQSRKELNTTEQLNTHANPTVG